MQDLTPDPFFHCPQNKYSTSEGDVALPVLYFDASNFIAMFFVDHERAQSLVRDDGFEAVECVNGKALAAVAFYQYRQTSVGAYNEVGVAIAATPPGTPLPRIALLSLLRHPDNNRIGFNIIDLPVTTAAACAAGREIWGYPKFVTPITFALEGRRLSGSVTEPATCTDLLELSGHASLGVPAPLLHLVLYSRHNGKSLRATAITRGRGMMRLPGSIRLKVSDSGHRMAQNLRTLGLQNARPTFVSCTQALQLRLDAGGVLP